MKKNCEGWAWWLISIIPALMRLRQKDHQFQASLGYMVRLSKKQK
jgi:hypothetical protein